MAFQNTTTVFTSLSDFHELALTVLKNSIAKSKTQEITSRGYRKFFYFRFNEELKYFLAKEKITSYPKFAEIF